MFLILPKALMKFSKWPEFNEGCWNYQMIPIHIACFAIRGKNGKIVSAELLLLIAKQTLVT